MKKKDCKNKTDDFVLTYDNYSSLDKPLQKIKQPILKAACKKYKLKISGNKDVLIERLRTLFDKIRKIIIVQSILRRKQCYIYIFGRGPAINNRELCNNNTDFITLEPINEILFKDFYSYKDTQGFVYGFNLSSLLSLIKTKKNIINPYNRTAISKDQQHEIIKLYNNTFIINQDFRKENNFHRTSKKPADRNSNYRPRVIPRISNNTPRVIPRISTVDNYNPAISRNLLLTEDLTERIDVLNTVRGRTYQERTQNVFIEMDTLGNYTNLSWFTSLTHLQYVRLYRCLFDIWMYRAQLSYEIKRQICPFYDLFDGIFPRHMYYDSITNEQIKQGCLIVIENLVYSSADIEYRKIGTLHALTALTMVNPNARIAMPWLYDSVAY